MELPQNLDVIETSAYWTWMGKDGVGRTKVKEGAHVTIKEAKENSKAVLSLADHEFPLLIDSTGIKSITKEGRDYFSMNNRESLVIALGIVVNSPLSRVVGNFFMGLNKPRVDTKLFRTEEAALEWLKTYL